MPATRSSAATKCISEVPGLAKQTSTPAPANVLTRLSAPFICSFLACAPVESAPHQFWSDQTVVGYRLLLPIDCTTLQV